MVIGLLFVFFLLGLSASFTGEPFLGANGGRPLVRGERRIGVDTAGKGELVAVAAVEAVTKSHADESMINVKEVSLASTASEIAAITWLA